MQQNKLYYDNFFTNYPVNVHDNPARFSAVASLLRGKVLDVACGTGTLADYYNGSYVGIDISDVAIRKAVAGRRKDATFFSSDFTKSIRLGVHDFDSVYVGEFLEHIKSDERVFDNILKHCRRSARIVVSVPNADRVPDESHCRTFTVPEIRRNYSKYGKVRFHNYADFENRILFSIEVGAPDTDEISLVMIVKDEAKGVEKAIISALPLVDRVVVSVDTKTRDKTAEIAKLYADTLDFHEWQGSFAQARNFAQRNVASRWILFLDGHEYVSSMGNVREKLKEDVEGIFVTVKMESGMTFAFPRIYRSYIKFKNAVHNLNNCKTRTFAEGFIVVHDRENLQDKESAQRRDAQRDEHLPKMLKETLKKDKKNCRANFHLANFYMMKEKHDLAIKYYRRVMKWGDDPNQCYLSYLHYAALHAAKGHFYRPFFALKKADRLIPHRWETARTMGGLFFMRENWKDALVCLVEALQPNSRHYAYQPLEHDIGSIWDMIGDCFYRLGQNLESVTAYKRARRLTNDKIKQSFYTQKIELVSTLLPGRNEASTPAKSQNKKEAQSD